MSESIIVTIFYLFSYPSVNTTRLLLTYGLRWIDLDAVDWIRSYTALHIISSDWGHYDQENTTTIVEMLINVGAHLDCVNEHGQTPLDIAHKIETRTLLRSKQTPSRLKCLCARFITDRNLPYDHLWPAQTSLNTFMLLHGGLVKERALSDGYDSPTDLYLYDSDSENENF